ncbi:MAG TPA: glycosyltransferase [Telluria sp.]
MRIYFLATTTGSRPDLFEDLVASFNRLAVPPGVSAGLLVLDQAQASHDAIFSRHPAAAGRTITRIVSPTLIGLSLARNRLLQLLTGDGYVVFCDDDATYPEDFLACLQAEFARAGEVDIGVFRLMNKEGGGTYGNRRYPAAARRLKRGELINLAISLNLVIRLACIRRAGGFNEELGVGSKGMCGEETELVLKAIDCGASAAYFCSPVACHPSQGLAATAPRKLYDYSRGYRNMLLSYQGSAGLRLLVRWHLAVAIARSMVALVIQGERSNRLIKLKGLAGFPDAGTRHG